MDSPSLAAAPGPLKIVIVAEHASAEFGGEAALPLHYFRLLRRRDHQVWLLVHERTRQELTRLFGDDPRIIYMPDTAAVIALWRIGSVLPDRIAYLTTSYLMRIITQRRQLKAVRELVSTERVDVIHQPIPVSPREPSLLYGLTVPVVIGPMNGGMNYPPGLRSRSSRIERLAVAAGRAASNAANRLFPGKREAAAILVANERTRNSLPSGIRGRIVTLVENGVDLAVWKEPATSDLPKSSTHTRFVFIGRLVALKAVDFLVEAFQRASLRSPMSLLVIGDGTEREALEAQAASLALLSPNEAIGKVTFAGWLSQNACVERLRDSDALVLPSIHECGGAVVLEAMAMKRPVIATAWGGPKDYVDDSCGILINPDSREQFIADFADAMVKLSKAPELRVQMGEAGRERIRSVFDWELKADAITEIYREVIADHAYAAN